MCTYLLNSIRAPVCLRTETRGRGDRIVLLHVELLQKENQVKKSLFFFKANFWKHVVVSLLATDSYVVRSYLARYSC